VREILINPKYTGYMVWNRRAMKDRRHPGKHNPRDEWVISSQPQHPALVSIETFLAAQVSRRRVGARPDSDAAGANPHPNTKTVYRLRSYVFCALCDVRMYGKRNRHGTIYSYCQPRDRPLPDGHTPTIWLREDRVLEALTTFFNTYVLAPDRMQLVAASLPPASKQVVVRHQRDEEAIKRKIAEINGRMDNLIGTLERSTNPGGQFALRTEHRIGDLEREAADLTRKLHDNQVAAPKAPADDVSLLRHLPVTTVDLKDLATDRLRRFLEAFHIEIHYDASTRRARIKAQISAKLVDQLAQAVSWAARTRTDEHEEGPASDGGANKSTTRSYELCPRSETSSNCVESTTRSGHSYELCPRPDIIHSCTPGGLLTISADLSIR
jgi:hypothetical protein